MHLVETADNPAPPDAIVSPIVASDGVVLRAVHWPPRRNAAQRLDPVGTVTICVGRAEFIEKYFEVAGELLARGFAVVAFDWRGQGLSGRELANPRKGHVDDFALFERDLAALTRQILEPYCPKPWFALAHSMGGAVVIRAARAGTSPFERIVLSAPMIDIAGVRFPRGVRLLAELLDIAGLGGSFIPGGRGRSAFSKPFEGNPLTSDQRRYARASNAVAAAPELGIGDPTIGWLNAAFRAMADFAEPEYPRRTLTPMLVISPGADRVVDTRAMERFATRLKAGRLVVIPHARHEILMERDPFREQFWAAFDAFVPGTREELEALETAHVLRQRTRLRRRGFMGGGRDAALQGGGHG